MIQPQIVTEIGLPHIHRGDGQSATDGYEEQSSEQQQKQRNPQRVIRQLHTARHRRTQQASMEKGINQQGIEQHGQHPSYHHPHTDAGHGILRRREKVKERSGIQRESPKGIQPDVDRQYKGKQQSHRPEIELKEATKPGGRGPNRHHQQ